MLLPGFLDDKLLSGWKKTATGKILNISPRNFNGGVQPFMAEGSPLAFSTPNGQRTSVAFWDQGQQLPDQLVW